MKTELLLKFNFEASHSLAQREEPHPHIWRLEVVLAGTPIDGKIIDMVFARERILIEVEPLKLTFLNDNPRADAGVRAAPTCESLCDFFWNRLTDVVRDQFSPHNFSIQLQSVGIALSDMNGEELGFVKRS